MRRNNGKKEIKELPSVEVAMKCRDIDQVFMDMENDLNDVKVTIRSWFNRKIGGCSKWII